MQKLESPELKSFLWEAANILIGKIDNQINSFVSYSITICRKTIQEENVCIIASLPIDLIEYVVLHELAHTKYKGHSKLYWGYLNNICNGYQKYEKELRSRWIGII